MVIVGAGAAMAWLSWLRWPDLFIDFGRETYIPWRLSEGEVLYHDIAYWNGPLSPYLNSVLFRIFGTAIFVLEAFNMLVIAGITWLAYKLFEDDDALSATTLAVVFLTVFAFAQLTLVGNYNFVAPYSHELTHGIFISFLAIYLLKLYLTEQKPLWLFGVALCTGLSLLTKLEITVALCAAVLGALALMFWAQRPTLKTLLIFGAGVILPPLLAIISLAPFMGAGQAFSSIFGSWFIIFATDISAGQYQLETMGTDDVGGNVKKLLLYASIHALWLGCLALVNWLITRKANLVRNVAAALGFMLTALVLGYFFKLIPWRELFRPLPLVLAVVIVTLAWQFLADRRDPATLKRVIPILAMAVFSFAMLFKMFLNVTLSHYGFVLAMPATLVAVHAAIAWAPRVVGRFCEDTAFFRFGVVAAVLVCTFWYVSKSEVAYSLKTHRFASGGDTIISYDPRMVPEEGIMETALDEIERVMAPGETFIVMAQGVLLNYLSRRVNASRYYTFIPPEITMFGEDNMLESIKRDPPDHIIFMHSDTEIYGYRFFGADYGKKLFAWVNEHYAPVSRIGAIPFTGDNFGMIFTQRRSE